MADVFKRFTQKAANTAAITIFTVPVANVAATPPTPVSTFIVQTIILHNDSGSGTVNAKIKKQVNPKKGRLLVFDGSYWHTAYQPKENIRCVININVKC